MSSNTESQKIIGQVKWFNNKAGYGFITVNDGEYAGKDIFAHYSSIGVNENENEKDKQYKYLVQGEYVEFYVEKTNTEGRELQSTKISGIHGGKLMYETRQMRRLESDGGVPQESDRPKTSRPKTNRNYRVRKEKNGKTEKPSSE